MSSPPVLNFAKLLADIPAPANVADPAAYPPVGIDLRANRPPPNLYDQIRDAHGAARRAEDAQVKQKDDPNRPDLKVAPPEWRPVLQYCVQALTEKTKDLQITTYLIDALLRLHGFAGLRDGFRLARELIEKFWDGLYPLPDEEGLTTRVTTLTQFIQAKGRTPVTVFMARVPLTEDGAAGGALTLDDHVNAVKLETITDPKSRQGHLEQGQVTLDQFRQRAAGSSAPFYIALAADLAACQDELKKLVQALDQRCAKQEPRVEVPSYTALDEQLEACLRVIRNVAADKFPVAAAAVVATPAAKVEQATTVPVENPEAIRDREEAFRVLAKVAEFFKRTEPHSVVSYSLEQVVRWGRMPLPDLLSELIPDEAPRKSLFQRVGIKAEAAKGDGKK